MESHSVGDSLPVPVPESEPMLKSSGQMTTAIGVAAVSPPPAVLHWPTPPDRIVAADHRRLS